jgi:Tol biopolymer transport system component
MKGKLALVLGVLPVFGLVFAGCEKGTANGTDGMEKQLVGTWEAPDGSTAVFNADGTASLGGEVLKYGAAGSKLALLDKSGKRTTVTNFGISSDGKTLILSPLWGSNEGTLLRKMDTAAEK